MKRIYLITMLLFCLCAVSVKAQTQDSLTTDGPVWRILYFKIKLGKRADYMKSLSEHGKPIFDEEIKQGLFLDVKFFVKPTKDGPNDWDIAQAILFRNYTDALEHNEENSKKAQAIVLKHYGTAEARKKETEQIQQMVDLLSTQLLREMILNPIK